MFDRVRRPPNDSSSDDDEADDAAPSQQAAPSSTQAAVNKEAKPLIPGADQMQNRPTTYLAPLPWEIEQLYRAVDEPHNASVAPRQSPTAASHTPVPSRAKGRDLMEKPSAALADRLRVAPTAKGTDKLADKPSLRITPGDAASARDLATSAARLSIRTEAPPPLAPSDGHDGHDASASPAAAASAPDISVVAPTCEATSDATVDHAHTSVSQPAGASAHALASAARSAPLAAAPVAGAGDDATPADAASAALPIVLSEAPTLRLAPPDPTVAIRVTPAAAQAAVQTAIHAAIQSRQSSGAEPTPALVAADQADSVATPGAEPPSVAELATAPLDPTAPQGIPYPQLTMRAISEPDDVAWHLPDWLAQGFDNLDGDTKGGNRAPDERGQTPELAELAAPITPPDSAQVNERIRGMVSALLSHPRLRASLPDEEIATLQLLLAPSPTADQIARGMSTLATLRVALEVVQAEALVATLPEALQTWYHAANWQASRLWLARHLDELPADAQTQLASATAQLRAMGADAAKTMERHTRLLDAARRIGVDAAYRDAIGDEAFGEQTEENAANDIAALKRIFDTLLAWIETPNWAASRDFLLAHHDLLDDEAEAILARMYEVETEQRDQRDRQVIMDHQRLLRDARQFGVDAAYVARARRANAIRESVTPAQAHLAIPLMVWIETPEWNTSPENLRAHPALLSDDGEVLLTRLVATQVTEHGRQSVADHQRLLGDARERGIDLAYDAFREERRARRRRAAQADGEGAPLPTTNGAHTTDGTKATSGPEPNVINGINRINGATTDGQKTNHSGPTDTPRAATSRRYQAKDGADDPQ